MDVAVFIVVGEWRLSKEEEWEFIPEKDTFGRCVCVKQHMTYTELTCTVCDVFNLNVKAFSPKISYWMPGMMSSMIERKRPPVYIDNQIRLDTFINIRSGDPSVSMFVSFVPTVEEDVQTVCGEKVSNQRTNAANKEVHIEDEEDEEEEEDEEDEDYEYNKSNDFVINNYATGYGEFTDLLAMCSKMQPIVVEDEDHGEILAKDMSRTTYMTSGVRDVRSGENFALVSNSTYTSHSVPEEVRVPEDDDLITEEQPKMTVKESYAVYKEFPSLFNGESEIVCGTDPVPVFDDLEAMRQNHTNHTESELCSTGETLYVGSVFRSRKVLQDTMSVTAVKGCFCYKQIRSNPRRLELVCVDPSCAWFLTANVVPKSENFKISGYASKHSCDINKRKKSVKHANYKVIAQIMKDRYSSTQQGPRAIEVPQLMLNEMNVRISYSTAWRAKEVAVENARGDEAKSYKFLPTYLFLLRKANPGTIYHLHSTPEVDGSSRFKYLFVSLGASIKGLKNMRKVVVVDGTQLLGRYKGCLLIACAQDGNFQIFPIAFGVVDGETDASWIWFFDKLSEIVPDSEELMIVSDKHSSIYKGISVVYPRAHHGACVVHLERNLAVSYGKYGVSGLFFSAAKSFRVREFNIYFEELRQRSQQCAKYLEDVGLEHWTRAHCQDERYNLMSSNIVESMNGLMIKAKAYPIVYMIEFIRWSLTRWFAARRKKGEKCLSSVTPEVDEQFFQELPPSGKYSVMMSGPFSYQITSHSGEHFHVVLDLCTCTCLMYTRLKIPCEHALAAALWHGIDPKSVVGEWYKVHTFVDSYQEPILPIEDPSEVEIPQNISEINLIPPKTRRPPG